MLDRVKYHIARTKLDHRSTSFATSFFKTVLNGEVICFTYNNLSDDISNVYCTQIMAPDDLDLLVDVVKDFFGKRALSV